jgi:hypothetical protein
MKTILLSTLLLGALANATTISMTPVQDGKGTIGTPSYFEVVGGTITINSQGAADIVLNYDYHPTGSGGPTTTLGEYNYGGTNLNTGDLLFEVGNTDFGIAIENHSGAPNGGNASQFASETAGNFYEASTLLTAQTVLNNPPGADYRNNTDVWLGGTLTDLGQFTETVTYHAGSTPEYTVELTGQLPTLFLNDVNADGGFQVQFSSATCGNGELVGSESGILTKTPEPASIGLIGLGLVGIALVGRGRKKSASGV